MYVEDIKRWLRVTYSGGREGRYGRHRGGVDEICLLNFCKQYGSVFWVQAHSRSKGDYTIFYQIQSRQFLDQFRQAGARRGDAGLLQMSNLMHFLLGFNMGFSSIPVDRLHKACEAIHGQGSLPRDP